MSRLRLNKIITPATPAANKGEMFYSSTLSPAGPAWIDENGKVGRVPAGYVNGSTATPGAGFASDTYLAGSSINIGTAGAWKAQALYVCEWEASKTGVGTAQLVTTLRMGTLGTVSDAAIQTSTFTAQTGVIDTGTFRNVVSFRAIGSGTSAVVQVTSVILHALASTGFTSAGTAGFERVVNVSSGFDSTVSNIIGMSVNFGASANVTITAVQASLQM